MDFIKSLLKEENEEKELNKICDKIIELFCVVDDRKYPESTGICGMDTEIYSTDEEKTARQKAREDIKKILKK